MSLVVERRTVTSFVALPDQPGPTIEKRPPTAFLWSSSPFELDGWEDARIENPGVDCLLPYWVARSYGILR